MADTGNLYVCIKPFAAGEVMTTPADDPEHWALYLPRPEKGADGAAGASWLHSSHKFPPLWDMVEIPVNTLSGNHKLGDYIFSTHEESNGFWGVVEAADENYCRIRVAGSLGGPRGRSIFATPNMLQPSGESVLNKTDISGDPVLGDLLISTNEDSPGRLGIVTVDEPDSFKARTSGDLCPANGAGGSSQEWIVSAPTGFDGKAGDYITLSKSGDLYDQNFGLNSLIYDTGGSIGVVNVINGDAVGVSVIHEGDENGGNWPAFSAQIKYGGSGTILTVPSAAESSNFLGYEIYSSTDLSISIDAGKIFRSITVTKIMAGNNYSWLVEGVVKNAASFSDQFFKITNASSFNVQMQNSGHSYTIITKAGKIFLT